MCFGAFANSELRRSRSRNDDAVATSERPWSAYHHMDVSVVNSNNNNSHHNETSRTVDPASSPECGRVVFQLRDLVALPLDDFKLLLNSSNLSEPQKDFCRMLRRKGTNREAARKSRSRRMKQIKSLYHEVGVAKSLRRLLKIEQQSLERLKADWDDLVKDVEAEILEALGSNPRHFELVSDRELVFVVRSVK